MATDNESRTGDTESVSLPVFEFDEWGALVDALESTTSETPDAAFTEELQTVFERARELKLATSTSPLTAT